MLNSKLSYSDMKNRLISSLGNREWNGLSHSQINSSFWQMNIHVLYIFRYQNRTQFTKHIPLYQYVNIYLQGLIYNSVYSAFQAARTDDQELINRINQTQTVQEAYQIAQHIDDPSDWTKKRLKVMELLIRDKFRRNSDIRDLLKATNTYQLVNAHKHPSVNNYFWGIVDGKGQNQLGRLLEQIRSDIISDEDIDKWLLMTFQLETDEFLLPNIRLEIMKESETIPSIDLPRQAYFYFGKHKKNHIELQHPTISRRHAVLFINAQSQCFIMDLGSKGGTFINDQFIEPHQPQVVMSEDKLRFARSTRTYSVFLDYDHCRKNLKDKIWKVEQEVKRLERLVSGSATKEELKASMKSIVEDTIMVENLPEKTSHFELTNLFIEKNSNKIKELRIPQDRQTGKTKNIAFVIFLEERFAKYFKERDRDRPTEYKGQKLKLTLVDQGYVDQYISNLRWGIEKEEEPVPEPPKKIIVKKEVKKEVKKDVKVKKEASSSSSSSSSDSSSSDSSSSSSSSRQKKKIKPKPVVLKKPTRRSRSHDKKRKHKR